MVMEQPRPCCTRPPCHQSIIATNSGDQGVSTTLAHCPNPGILWGLDRLEAWLLAGSANTVVKQTQINSSQEKPITQEAGKGLEKRKGEIYFRWQQLRKVTGLSLNNRPLQQQDGHLELSRAQEGTCKRRGREHLTVRIWYVVSP